MNEPYDCTADVLEHKRKVKDWMNQFSNILDRRALIHDDSKLQPPEKECFDTWMPELKTREFGSEYYKVALDAMGEGIAHHYRVNPHHPEHYENGVADMCLHDVVEMVCDWMAAAQAHGIPVDLDHAAKRFQLSPQLASIIRNTLEEMNVTATLAH